MNITHEYHRLITYTRVTRMFRPRLALLPSVFICVAFWLHGVFAQETNLKANHAENMKQGTRIFKEDVRAILTEHCVKCHNAKSAKADFDLSSRTALVASGHLGDSAENSPLLKLVQHREEPHMPLKAPKLAAEEIDAIARWIDLGAPYAQPLIAGRTEPATTRITEDDRNFWSFAPLERPAVPHVVDSDWCRTAIDHFILSRLRDEEIAPNPCTQPQLLIRRAYYGLLGLPPTTQEIDQFTRDSSPAAYDRLIVRLLNSRHYGERWARHWLDIARFAESTGFEHDDDRPHAYHYRDFVIKAFNQDLPFDQFIRWQLAGDELAPDNPLAMMATGFLGAGPSVSQLTEAEFESARYDEIDDMVTNTGIAFLGLSIGCARCHDHKYDPIPAADYYAVAATFAKTVRSEVEMPVEPASPAVPVQITADGFTPIRNHAHDRGYPYFYEHVHFLRRGDVDQKEQVCQPGFVQVLQRGNPLHKGWQVQIPAGWKRSDFHRATLAGWITDPNHGAGHLAARVIVNRLWQHHFGQGLVATPNDFGLQGERPTHPALLDWLACELIDHQWSLKHIHRLIMNSAVYCQNDSFDEVRGKLDPGNLLHWRRSPRRLEAEAIRDAMLFVSGQLDTTMYGPGSLDERMRRRSIYFTIKRSKLIPTMMLFDWPEHLVSIGQRPVTTTAPQALSFMNNNNTRSQAESFADYLQSKYLPIKAGQPVNWQQAIEQTYRIAYARPVSSAEATQATAFLNRQLALYDQAEATTGVRLALTDFSQMIFSSSEFLYIR
ncbi:MAG: PSD1 and planctomycete cytochrome C domain-containing protein [Pirellulaceae bacterium]|nr:PSD1 and planctomycete cytochrome C domain-containing protein [Pirellulaceae bacterium]